MIYFKIFFVLISSLSIIGCSTYNSQESYQDNYHNTEKKQEIVMVGMAMLNTKYNWGGKRPDFGLDCSGLVTQVYQKSIGYKINGAAKDMAKQGKTVPNSYVFSNKLEIGDLLFFNTTGKSYSHVGIYIGNEKFLHASSGKGQVITSSIHNSYYKKRLELVKRII